MFKLLITIATTLVIFVEPMQAQWCAEQRLKYAMTSLMGKFMNTEVEMNPETSVTMSTFSLVSMLSILALHSSGNTQQELLDILNLKSCDEIRSIIPKYLAKFNTQEENKSVLYFKAFANISDPFTDLFKENLAELLGGEIQNIDYNHPRIAATVINQWVKHHTFNSNGKHVIRENKIPDDPAILFVSTQSLDVNFDNPFNVRGTTNVEFHVNNNEVVTMPAIYGGGLMKIAVVDWLDCTVIDIPMKGGKNSVVIFYPNEVEGLNDLVYNLKDADRFYEALDMLEESCITVYIPLGEANAVVDYRKHLEHIISSTIFDPASAEFCGISQGPNPVYVSSMLHRVYLTGTSRYNESATTTSPNCCGDSDDMPVIILNHPLAYYVMEKEYNMPTSGGVFYKST